MTCVSPLQSAEGPKDVNKVMARFVMTQHTRIPGFRLGIYVCKDAEIIDFAAPHGVFSVARLTHSRR